MKAEELMIGDWVNVGNDEFTFHDQIYSLGYDEVDSGHSDMVGTYRYDELFPIPITPEILEKNGFGEQRFERMSVWSILGFSIELHFSTWKYYWANGDVEISSVHELQHALRLCGIDKTIEL